MGGKHLLVQCVKCQDFLDINEASSECVPLN